MKRFLTSAMIPVGVRFFAALAVFGLIGMIVNGLMTCFPANWSWTPPQLECRGDQGIIDALLGPVTGGWKGGVGNHFVYGIFLGVTLASAGMAGLLAAFRDADPKALAEVVHTEAPPVIEPPRHHSYWPFAAAVSTGAMVAGLVVHSFLFLAGAFALVLVGIEWAIRTWAENATVDERLNEEFRERLAAGLEVPVLAVLLTGVFVLAGSRVFLAVSEMGAVVIAGIAAFVMLMAFSFVAYYPRASRSVVSIFVILAGIIVIGSGIFGAAIGEREFELHHEEEHHDDEADEDGADEDEAEDAEQEEGS